MAVFGVLAVFSLATHAGAPALSREMDLPWLITGHFTYVEYTKSNVDQVKVVDENTIKVEYVDFLLTRRVFDQAALYTLDRAEFNAQGQGSRETRSAGCINYAMYDRSGGGKLDFPEEKFWAPSANPSHLTWLPGEDSFKLHFQAPIDSGTVTKTETSSCSNVKGDSITSEYLWACDLEGQVDYDAATKTYRFVLLKDYKVPYREDRDIESRVVVQGELTGPLK
ncbi:MAG: hypothetical protein A2Y56_16185 [Candidatus Aminicenantes bacterium RBG_13_63_10]|nr:MAG: hypothetical protein A2Y56_16185 [Candidatus Aminicenantes bacterium RBG_13_63_10]